jgi:hypothetical protein
LRPSKPSALFLKKDGLITHYEISGWDGALDVTISSLLPGDAREAAEGTCAATQQLFAGRWQRAWELRVFILTSNDRPAAVCKL